VPELREILAAARARRSYEARRTLLFVDEVHRFNKGQQDAFLPHVEDGTVTLVGATTENPAFYVNAAVLSRCQVLHLEPLGEEELVLLLRRALADARRGLGALGLGAEDEALAVLARAADGDARQALGLLEGIAADLPAGGSVTVEAVRRGVETVPLRHDKSGDGHYDVASALIKSLRGSDPDAAIYWLMRMIDAGEDPAFVLRRLLIFAGEDVGLADPRALLVATAADQAFHRLGMPEGLYPVAEACLYLATCPKSGSVGAAFSAAREAIAERGSLAVPKKLRNAPTALARAEGHGDGYRSPHAAPEGFLPGETYLPEELAGASFYEPTPRGYEAEIGKRLAAWRHRSGPSR